MLLQFTDICGHLFVRSSLKFHSISVSLRSGHQLGIAASWFFSLSVILLWICCCAWDCCPVAWPHLKHALSLRWMASLCHTEEFMVDSRCVQGAQVPWLGHKVTCTPIQKGTQVAKTLVYTTWDYDMFDYSVTSVLDLENDLRVVDIPGKRCSISKAWWPKAIFLKGILQFPLENTLYMCGCVFFFNELKKKRMGHTVKNICKCFPSSKNCFWQKYSLKCDFKKNRMSLLLHCTD